MMATVRHTAPRSSVRTSSTPKALSLKSISVCSHFPASTSGISRGPQKLASKSYTQSRSYSSTPAVAKASTPSALEWINNLMIKVRKGYLEQPQHTQSQPQPPAYASVPQLKNIVNPVDIVEPDLKAVKENIVKLLKHTEHPVLLNVARCYVDLKGKRFRPTVLLLLSRAIQSHLDKSFHIENVHPRQIQLAEIVEMIHTASIVHDDVIDDAETRRGQPSVNISFGNKLAILSGDYLLARASVSLSFLENHEVTRLISTVISDLVEGELMQIKPTPSQHPFDYYIKKTYMKTASLIANGCRSAAILSTEAARDDAILDMATEYGKNLGLAFQVTDDLLDFTGSQEDLGKAPAVDLSLGLATAPVLYARDEFPELSELIQRKFKEKGDVEKARALVAKSSGLNKTRTLAQQYSQAAIQSLDGLHSSVAKDALIALAKQVVDRKT